MAQFERFLGLKNQHFFSELVENLRYAFKNYGSDTKSTHRQDQIENFYSLQIDSNHFQSASVAHESPSKGFEMSKSLNMVATHHP